MKISYKIIRFVRATVLSAILLLTGLMPFILSSSVANAFGLVTSRSITLSSSSDAASTATTTYTVSFTTAATTNYADSLIIDFCSNDPIIADSCTAPTGLSTSAVTLVTSPGTFSGDQTGLTWAVASVDTNRSVRMTPTGTPGGGGLPSGTVFSFAIGDIQNPTTLGTFYARIMDFNTQAGAASWVTACGTSGNCTTGVQDAGGVALSTVQSITITAKVQEQLTFCVGTTTVPSDNTGATPITTCTFSGSTVNLGNTEDVLSTTGPYVDVSTQYLIQTNAANSAAIVLQGQTLQSGGQSIAAMGANPGALDSNGTSQFGLCTYEAAGSSNLTFTNETGGASGAYDNSNCTLADLTQTATYGSTGGISGSPKFGFNTTATTTAAGDPLATEAPGSQSVGVIAMIANVGVTQQAGIYTTALSFIATGSY